MTDKQIMIDDVDVSGCSYHYKHTRVCLVKMDAAGRYYNCANWHDCDFKKLSQKLKAKEQECEMLKLSEKSLTETIENIARGFEELKADNKHLNDLLNQALKENEELQQLKDEDSLRVTQLATKCSQLVRENKELKKDYSLLQLSYDSLKTTEDIKISERTFFMGAIRKLNRDILDLMATRKQYREAIEKIKEMCISVKNIENVNSLHDAKLSGMYLQARKILEICDEVNKDE